LINSFKVLCSTQNKIGHFSDIKARFSCLLQHPAGKQRWPILISALHKAVLYSVVKVRGNANPGPQIISGQRSSPHTAVNSTSRLREPLQLTVGPKMFSEFLDPQIYT